MKKITRILVSVAVMSMLAFTAYSQDIFKSASVGIGTTSPAQKLEIAGTANTIRIDGLVSGGTYNPLTSVAGTSSNLVYVNNSTGDLYALPSAGAGSVLTISATGVPTWSTTAVSGSAWLLAGNAVAYSPAASPTTYIGTTSGNGAGFQFGIGGVNAGRVEAASNYNTALGYLSLNAATTASGTSQNTAIGYNALAAYAASGGSNTVVGYGSMGIATSGSGNVGVGENSFGSEASPGSSNVAVGFAAANFMTGSYNTALGYFAFRDQSATGGTYGIALGYYAGSAGYSSAAVDDNFLGAYSGALNSVTGGYNNSIGAYSLYSLNSGTDNDAHGYQALYSNTSGSQNAAFGYNALYSNSTTSDNSAMGYYSLRANIATGNSAFGWEAMEDNTGGAGSVAVGYQASALGLTSNYNTVVGYQAAYNNTFSGTAGNTVMGYQAYYSNTTGGSQNTAIGYHAMYAYNASSGGDDVAIGYGALGAVTTSVVSDDVAIGVNAMGTGTSGANNTAVGFGTMNYNTGNDNTGLGYWAMRGASGASGSYNVGIGWESMPAGYTGNYNNFMGYESGSVANAVGGTGNDGLGAFALYTDNGGSYDDAIGYQALYSNSSGSYNAAFGDNALYSNSTTSDNTAMGYYALRSNTAAGNTAVGYQSGYTTVSGNANTSGTNNTFIGANSGPGSSTQLTNATAIGANATVAESNAVVLGSVSGFNGASTTANVGIGTNAPNAGAALDITSSTQGLLIPRMATAPASPATSMIYYNTGSGCFMFWNGTAWQTIVCTCTTPGAAGTITGPSTYCSGQTGVVYTVPAVTGATGYAWSIPSDATITAGWGSPSITVTFGSVPTGTISVAGTNSCGEGLSSSLTITNSGADITGNPVNATIATTSSGTFSVTASGSSLTYQWEVSTNSGSSWTALTDGGVYSGSLTATLTITDPTSGMNGYEYECIVTGSCGSPETSTAATLTVCTQQSVPIVIHNAQTTGTNAGLQVQVTVNSSTYAADGENASLNNVEFTTGPSGGGTPLYAWIESATTTPPSSTSTSTLYWVNLGSLTIAGSSSTTIYMNFEGSAVMTGTTGYMGEAPQLSTTYGQYDNGAYVFGASAPTPGFYDGFAGSGLDANWTSFASGSGTTVVNNGLTITSATTTGTFNWANVITSTSTYSAPLIAETYATTPAPPGGTRSYQPGLISNNATTEGVWIGDAPFSTGNDGGAANPTSYVSFTDGRSSANEYAFLQGASTSSSPYADYDQYDGSGSGYSGYNVWGLGYTTSGDYLWENYTTNYINASTSFAPTGSMYFALGIGAYNAPASTNFSAYWARTRVFPPNATLPTATAGTYGCY